MKSTFKKIGYIILGILGLGLIMTVFKLCPPTGPWPTPPWCVIFERQAFDVEVNVVPLSAIPAIGMFDTWGRNYNFRMFENTRDNIESSFERAQSLGAKEVFVHDFHRVVYRDNNTDISNTNYDIVDETFWNDFRDESFSEKDIRIMANAAHTRGMTLGISHNLAFVNIGKYITKGITGEISASVEEDYKKLTEATQSEEWIRVYFSKWQERLVARAKLYEKYHVDMMDVSPGFMTPSFSGHEILANTLWKDLIKGVRTEFSGKIVADASLYGFLDGRIGEENYRAYDYFNDADIVLVPFYGLHDIYRTPVGGDTSEIYTSLKHILGKVTDEASRRGLKLSLFFSPFSYKDAINQTPIEALDLNNPAVKNLVPDGQHQADAYQAMFEVVSENQTFERIITGNMWWDDALDPLVPVRVSIMPSFRNKPAESVIQQWFKGKIQN